MLIDLLRKRTSVRKFENKEIPVEIIDGILEAGRLAPSGGMNNLGNLGLLPTRN